MSNNPLLSVVTVTFNPGESLLKTVKSVENQTERKAFEFIIVDGESSDGTLQFLNELKHQGSIDQLFVGKDSGIYDAMNRGVAIARGEFILFLNAGDCFYDAHSAKSILDACSLGVNFVWGDCVIESHSGERYDSAQKMIQNLPKKMSVSHQSLIVRKSFLKEHPFDLSYSVAADYDVLCRLVSEKRANHYLPIPLSRIAKEGFSSRNFFRGVEEKRLISRKYFPRQYGQSRMYFWFWAVYMRGKIFLNKMRGRDL